MALFKTFGMQIDDMLIFFLRSFRIVRFWKMQFLEDGHGSDSSREFGGHLDISI